MKLLKFIIKPFKSESSKVIILTFIIWKISLFLILSLAIIFIPLYSKHFLGGGLGNYSKNPYIFAWANFDGEHYLSIAQGGYGQLNHAFFPLYPLLINILSLKIQNIAWLIVVGLFISSICFLIGLFLLQKLTRLDFPKSSLLTILALITFPTSFYFGALYTESLFLMLSVGAFYFARVGKWWIAGILGGLSSATRIYGILIFPALLIDWFQNRSKYGQSYGQSNDKNFQTLLALCLIPVGFLCYIFYLYLSVGDVFVFYKELSIFGEQRSGNLILLPQILYRYFKMLTSVDIQNPIY